MIILSEFWELGKKGGKWLVNKLEIIFKYFYWIFYYLYLLVGFIIVEIRIIRFLIIYILIVVFLEFRLRILLFFVRGYVYGN